MRPITITPTKEEALAKLREQCESWGISNVTKYKFTELVDLLNSAIAKAVAIPALRPLWFDSYCGKTSKTKPPRYVKGRTGIQEKSFIARVVGLLPLYALFEFKCKNKRVKLCPNDTWEDFLEHLQEKHFTKEAKFLEAFIDYMSQHLIPEEWTGYTKRDFMRMEIGSMNKTFADMRSKSGNPGWSYQYIDTLGGPSIRPQHEQLLSGQCYDYWLIWDLVIPEGDKKFRGQLQWEQHYLTAEQQASGFAANNGKRFYELKLYK